MILCSDIEYSHLTNFKLLGKGIFGIVYKALYLGTEVAVKECLPLLDQPGYNLEKYFTREVTILKECRHPNIVQYMGTCIHEGKFYIITEYIKNDNLKTWLMERLDELPWRLRVNFAIDIARAMAYLHSKNIIHRDIKPENILITENGRAKICDFGFSRFAAKTEEERRHLSYCGTEAYMAPEIILCMDFDMSVDIFGYGVILCEMIAGKIAEKAFKRKIPGFEIDSHDINAYADKDKLCPKEFVDLAIKCTDYERQKRPSWIEIIEKLNEIEESIVDDYNIGIIPASELLSNDFLIPISPMIKGQNVDEYNSYVKKASSIKSLNIDVDDLKNSQKEKYNGRPTSPTLNTKRLSNQYYYYYAVNSPTNDKHESSVYHRLPAYITPPLEHSSIIAIPKGITKSNSISFFSSVPSSNNSNTNSNNNCNNSSQGYDYSNNNSYSNEATLKSSNSESSHPINFHDSLSEDTRLMNSQTLSSSALSISSSMSSSSSFSLSSNGSLRELSSNDMDTLINTYNNSNTSLNKMFSGSGSNSSSNSNQLRKDTLERCKNENKRRLFDEMLFKSSEKSKEKSSFPSPPLSSSASEVVTLKTAITSPRPKSPFERSGSSKIPILIRSKNSILKKKQNDNNQENKSKENIKFNNVNSYSISTFRDENNQSNYNQNHTSSTNSNDHINYEKKNITKKSSIQSQHSKIKKSNKKVTIEDIKDEHSLVKMAVGKDYSGIHHRFSINYYPSLSKCNVCHRRMTLVKRHLSCDDCDFHCHAKCSYLAPFSCKPKNK